MQEADFDKLCHLCRISASQEERKNFSQSIKAILTYIDQLNEVETSGVPSCTTIHETLRSVMREDIPEKPLLRDLALSVAPDHVGGMYRVPPVLTPLA